MQLNEFTKSAREMVILTKTINVFKKLLAPPRVILFGSRAKGKFKKYSDFDFAIDIKRPALKVQRKLNDEVKKYSGLYTIDIAYLKSVDADFKNIVLNTGKIIYEKRS